MKKTYDFIRNLSMKYTTLVALCIILMSLLPVRVEAEFDSISVNVSEIERTMLIYPGKIKTYRRDIEICVAEGDPVTIVTNGVHIDGDKIDKVEVTYDPTGSFTIQPGDCKTVTCIFKVPGNTNPGTYHEKLKITFHVGGGPLVTEQDDVSISLGIAVPTPKMVGGVLVPVDKFGLLAPYIGLASTIIVATAVTAIHVKRVKYRKKKQ